MFQRKKIIITEECMEWLKKEDSFEVETEQAILAYDKKCEEIQADVLKKLTNVSKESGLLTERTEVVVEVRLARARKLSTTLVATNVYAVVYTKNNKKKYCITLDENKLPKKVSKIDTDMFISKNGGDFFEQLKTIKSKSYKISM